MPGDLQGPQPRNIAANAGTLSKVAATDAASDAAGTTAPAAAPSAAIPAWTPAGTGSHGNRRHLRSRHVVLGSPTSGGNGQGAVRVIAANAHALGEVALQRSRQVYAGDHRRPTAQEGHRPTPVQQAKATGFPSGDGFGNDDALVQGYLQWQKDCTPAATTVRLRVSCVRRGPVRLCELHRHNLGFSKAAAAASETRGPR